MKTFLLASRHNIMFKCYDQDQSTMKILIQKTSLYLFIQMLCSLKNLFSIYISFLVNHLLRGINKNV